MRRRRHTFRFRDRARRWYRSWHWSFVIGWGQWSRGSNAWRSPSPNVGFSVLDWTAYGIFIDVIDVIDVI
ncbi:MAG: hypothetical protein HRU31_16980, partial [Rhodobacteraceae bacterium]|nr:hypothetical protein [Paracoccaceae bacterium]